MMNEDPWEKCVRAAHNMIKSTKNKTLVEAQHAGLSSSQRSTNSPHIFFNSFVVLRSCSSLAPGSLVLWDPGTWVQNQWRAGEIPAGSLL